MSQRALVHQWLGALGRYLDEAAEFWLGCDLPQAARVIAEADWRPDSSDAYCRRCGGSVGRGETSPCASCHGRSSIADGVVRLGPYGGQLREWILSVKYGRRWVEMGELLGRELGRSVRASGLVCPGQVAVVPMPMPWQRRLYRGVDHARVLAEGVAAELDASLVPLLRKRNGKPQVVLNRTQRARRGGAGYRVAWGRSARLIAGRDVVLVDDVRTTGASLRSAAGVLRRLKPRCVVGAVVAVTDDWSRRDRASQGRRAVCA